jgi:hypothetical protein
MASTIRAQRDTVGEYTYALRQIDGSFLPLNDSTIHDGAGRPLRQWRGGWIRALGADTAEIVLVSRDLLMSRVPCAVLRAITTDSSSGGRRNQPYPARPSSGGCTDLTDDTTRIRVSYHRRGAETRFLEPWIGTPPSVGPKSVERIGYWTDDSVVVPLTTNVADDGNGRFETVRRFLFVADWRR